MFFQIILCEGRKGIGVITEGENESREGFLKMRDITAHLWAEETMTGKH